MMPLAPEPRLSDAARPPVPVELPPDPPDIERAERELVNGAQGPRDVAERELLGHAMRSEGGLTVLRQLDPEEFWHPTNRNVARAILDLADQGLPHDAAAVTDELARRPRVEVLWPGDEARNSQLPIELNPAKHPRPGDLRTFGLRAWQRAPIGGPEHAHMLARQVRAYSRRDTAAVIAQRAVTRYHGALEIERGRVVEDGVGWVTKDLAGALMEVPKALPAQSPVRSSGPGLALPQRPRLSATAQVVLRQAG